MYLVYLLCLLVFMVWANWRFLGLHRRFGRGRRRRRETCGWRRSADTPAGGRHERWVCERCGITGLSRNGAGAPPCRDPSGPRKT